ncbi:MAG: hypothetical protein OHK0053_01140 [Microscillaceae bacterium]
MKKNTLFFTLLLALSLASCGGGDKNEVTKNDPKTEETTEDSENEEAVESSEQEQDSDAEPSASEEEYQAFLMSLEGTFGWRTPTDDKLLNFFEDGRLSIQGPDGEATMWEGSWTLKGDQLSIKCDEIELDQTYTVRIEGENLKLDNLVYSRIR